MNWLRDQHAAFVAPRRQKFLRHQIHAIVQRSHQAKIGGAVVALNLFVAVVPLQKYDGLPLAGLKAPVDSFRFGFHLGQEGRDSA